MTKDNNAKDNHESLKECAQKGRIVLSGQQQMTSKSNILWDLIM